MRRRRHRQQDTAGGTVVGLAHRFEHLIAEGVVADYAELARLGQVSRARISQIMSLRYLAPDIQEAMLFCKDSTRPGPSIRCRSWPAALGLAGTTTLVASAANETRGDQAMIRYFDHTDLLGWHLGDLAAAMLASMIKIQGRLHEIEREGWQW